MNHGRLRSWGLIASLLASNVAFAAPAVNAEEETDEAAPSPAGKTSGKASAKGAGKHAEPEAEAEADEQDTPAEETPAAAPTVTAPPVPNVSGRWDTSLYGFIELDGMHDSTQSYKDASNGFNVARRGTYNGDRGQSLATIKNTRLGLKIAAPTFGSIKTSGQIEMDFFGLQPIDSTQNDTYVAGTMRLRHAYMKIETPVLDVLGGQYHDLFGWGGAGFFPNTVAFLGVPGEIYHRNPQLRLSKTVGNAVSVEIAVAAVRPAQTHSELPDAEGGLKVAFNNWKGVSSQGSGQPQATPLSLGISGIGRRFVIPQFIGQPRNANTAYGYGFAVNAVIPVLPARSVEDRGNSLTLTGEFSIGTGIADLYSNMTAGAKFPELTNPGGDIPPFLYPQDVDPGLVTYDANKRAKTYNWTAFVAGLQYYLPVAKGRVWVSGIYGQLASNNITDLTPAPSWGAVYKFSRYVDGNLFIALTPSVQLGMSFQYTQQTYGDNQVVQPSGVVGPLAKPFNMRAEGSATFFF
jgi:hypothetical protein